MVRAATLAHDARWPGVGNWAHVEPDLSDDDLGGANADAGDLVEALEDWEASRRSDSPVSRSTGGPAAGMAATSSSMRTVSRSMSVPESVDLAEEHGGELGVVGVEATGKGLFERGVLGLHAPPGHFDERLGVAFAGDQRVEHRPARRPEKCR